MLKETLLFVALQPGMLLTLPPVGRKIFASCQTSPMSVVVHAAVVAAVLFAVKKTVDAFQNMPAVATTTTAPGVPGEPKKEGFANVLTLDSNNVYTMKAVLLLVAWILALILFIDRIILPKGIFRNDDTDQYPNAFGLFFLLGSLGTGAAGIFA